MHKNCKVTCGLCTRRPKKKPSPKGPLGKKSKPNDVIIKEIPEQPAKTHPRLLTDEVLTNTLLYLKNYIYLHIKIKNVVLRKNNSL